MIFNTMAYSLVLPDENILIIMNIKKLILPILFIFTFSGIFSQEKWTLEDCIDYAVSNNLQLQRQRLENETAEANLLKSKMDVLPNLNFGANARVGFGRSIDPVTNLITFKQNLSNSYNLSSSINLFNGFTQLNTISANKFMLKAGLENEKVARNTLIINVLGAYYQVLYAKGLEDAAKMQVDLSEEQLERMRVTVDVGKEAVSRLYEMESRASEDRLAYTVAVNSTKQAITSLRQLLQLEPGTPFDLLMPELDNVIIENTSFRADSVYSIAAEILPRLKAINYELQASRKQLAAARGSVYPQISLNGSLFTGYYKVIGEGVPDQDSFSTQLKNNNSQSISASINIPIFNNYTIGRNIKMAKIRQNDNELRLELEKNALYTEIENACLNYNQGRDEYIAAVSNLEYNLKSYDAVEKKFEAGLVDVTDFSAAKTTLFRADTEALRTKLQLLIRELTIEFYSTGEYKTTIR